MKQNRHSLMAKGIMVLLSLLIIVFIITFSWFTIAEPEASAEGLSANTKSGTDFEYAIGFSTSQTGGDYLVTEFTSNSQEFLDIQHLHVPGHYAENSNNLFDYNLLYDYTPIDITGDGVNLVRPSMDYGNWKINTGSPDYSIAEPNTQYISFDIIVRSKAVGILSLGPDSFAYGESERDSNNKPLPDGSKLTGSGSARPSDYAGSGNAFSTDAIVGATRVAFIPFVDDESNPVITADSLLSNRISANTSLDTKLANAPALLWVTRPDVYLSNNPAKDSDSTGSTAGVNHETDNFGWGLITDVASDRTFNHSSTAIPSDPTYTTYRHQQYDIFNLVDGARHREVVTNNNSYVHISSLDTEDDSYKFNDTVALTGITLPKTVEDTEYYYGKIRVRIWVEGTDSEARRALSGGKFNVRFDLTTK